MKRILLVEDDPSSQEVLTRRLERKGFEVMQAMDGTSAVRLARERSPDLILMDLNMPVLDGWGAIQQIKEDDLTHTIPIIVLSAYSREEEMERALSLGCTAYMVKPVDFKRLMDKIEDMALEERSQ